VKGILKASVSTVSSIATDSSNPTRSQNVNISSKDHKKKAHYPKIEYEISDILKNSSHDDGEYLVENLREICEIESQGLREFLLPLLNGTDIHKSLHDILTCLPEALQTSLHEQKSFELLPELTSEERARHRKLLDQYSMWENYYEELCDFDKAMEEKCSQWKLRWLSGVSCKNISQDPVSRLNHKKSLNKNRISNHEEEVDDIG